MTERKLLFISYYPPLFPAASNLRSEIEQTYISNISQLDDGNIYLKRIHVFNYLTLCFSIFSIFSFVVGSKSFSSSSSLPKVLITLMKFIIEILPFCS